MIRSSPDEMRWFAVISAKRTRAPFSELVEILDGPFLERWRADEAARFHRADGEAGAYARKRYVPRRPNWQPLFGPDYEDEDLCRRCGEARHKGSCFPFSNTSPPPAYDHDDYSDLDF